eukprot:Blabericola_migrator_1__9056@NODE_481_length_8138_cov_55_758146_g374_i0_p11_GENE_NODE_481_length_8138_cov_55_758146_g374_i0NODE_481_length_8138_cov_55_758146_g374_i0_p11_ORF_typecomplete_len107_score2_98HAP2GCS1/PF10699_9/0_0068_NODE_481_length_8138_cov_55_758146_g374_i074567776
MRWRSHVNHWWGWRGSKHHRLLHDGSRRLLIDNDLMINDGLEMDEIGTSLQWWWHHWHSGGHRWRRIRCWSQNRCWRRRERTFVTRDNSDGCNCILLLEKSETAVE